MNHSNCLRIVALLGVSSLGLACGSGETAGKGDRAPVFYRDPVDGPVIGSGTAGLPSLVADPCVVADSEGYHLFYSAFFCRKPDGTYSYSWDPSGSAACNLSQAFGTTGYAFSADRGLTWQFRKTPVVPRGKEDWNDVDIETPFVSRVGDRLFLFYCALGTLGEGNLQHRYQLGAATLDLQGRTIRGALMEEGATFTHRASPVVAADFSQRHGVNNAQEPSVVVRDGRLELFFTSLGLALPDKDIVAPGQEVSIALRVAVLDQNLAMLEPPSPPLTSGSTINIPEVHFLDGRYHLFATATELDDHEDDQLVHAESEDGRQFTAPQTILRRRPGAMFDNWGLMAPTIVVEPESLVLFYTGWEMQEHTCRLAGASGRMGMAIESRPNEARCLYATLGRATSTRR
jgi:predicted GH43/DUF377 family glycosyl hydrolase